MHLNKHLKKTKKKETETCSNRLFAQLLAQNMTNKNCKAIYSAFWHQSVHTQAESRSQTAQTRSQQCPGTGCTGCLKAKHCRDMGRKTK